VRRDTCPPPTHRLRFRSWNNADYALAESLWCDREVTHFFGGAMTPEQARVRMDAEQERDVRMGISYWPMFLRDTGDFAGCAGLRQWQYDASVMEAGVHLSRAAWGQRLGEEALRAVLAHGFDTLQQPKIVAGHGVGHANSQKLLERVGFRYTHTDLWGPKKIEVLLYALEADAWRAGASA
jgi:ribosomal-protein-alanine N-acetyltransferase